MAGLINSKCSSSVVGLILQRPTCPFAPLCLQVSLYASCEVKTIGKLYNYSTESIFISLLMIAHSSLMSVWVCMWHGFPTTNRFSHTSGVLHNSDPTYQEIAPNLTDYRAQL